MDRSKTFSNSQCTGWRRTWCGRSFPESLMFFLIAGRLPCDSKTWVSRVCWRRAFSYKVLRSIPSFRAASDLLPRDSRNTRTISCRSISCSLPVSVDVKFSGTEVASLRRARSRSTPSHEIPSVAAKIASRSIKFSSSLTLPGQLMEASSETASSLIFTWRALRWLKRSRKCCTSSGMSWGRSSSEGS